MNPKFRPMRAEAIFDLSVLRFPLLASAKIDGLRCVMRSGPKTSTLKEMPNLHTRLVYEWPELEGLDGELVVGEATDPLVFNKTQSAIMTMAGQPESKLYVFDCWLDPTKPFSERIKDLKAIVESVNHPNVVLLEQRLVHSLEELEAFETSLLNEGYEGVILRSPDAPYKYGRSTLNQQWALKLKRFVDSEARIVGFVEGMTNTNAQEDSELGLAKRSTKKEGMVPSGTLGALQVVDAHKGWEFEIGTGFTEEVAQHIWDNQQQFLGKYVNYQYFAVGMKDKPRFPSFKGTRHESDFEIRKD